MEIKTYRAGHMARFDAFGTGCQIRVRVLDVLKPGNGKLVGYGKIKVRVLNTACGWRKGEVIEIGAHVCIPCSHIKGDKIQTNFEWV